MEKLAICGGKPVRDSLLSYGRQTIDNTDIDAVIETLKGDYLTTGPKVDEFEKVVAEYTGTKYAVAVSNGTAALHIACLAVGLKEGDEVIVPSITFAATANSVLYTGATPIFADVDERTLNCTLETIIPKVTERTKAIIVVDMAGGPVDIDPIVEWAEMRGIMVIEDAAHALGSKYKGRVIGSKALITEFSFHPVKPVTTCEGGMVVTDSRELFEKLILYRTHGITRDSEQMTENHGPWYYEQIELGYNYRITDIQCALGISQMKKIEKFLARRREIAEMYMNAFRKNEYLIAPQQIKDGESGWHIYILRFVLDKFNVSKREIFEALRAENIGVNLHYLPVYLHPYYKKLGYKEVSCPVAEKIYEEMLTLPIYPSMTDQDVKDVIDAVNKIIDNFSR